MHQQKIIRFYWIFALLLLAIPLSVRLFFLFSTPISQLRRVVDFIFDDGYYYLTLAANLVDLGRTTLDGITPTNGYQPLWLILLSGLAKLVGTTPRPFFLAACVLIYSLAFLTPLSSLIWKRTSVSTAAFCFGAGLALVLTQLPHIFLEGMEPILMAPLVVPLVMIIESRVYDRKTLRHASIILAVAFLVRLDALALYVACFTIMPLLARWQTRPSHRLLSVQTWQPAFELSKIVVPVALAYGLVNLWLFGAPVPISGLAKSVGAPAFRNWGVLGELLIAKRWFALFLMMILVLELYLRSIGNRTDKVFYRSIFILSVACAIQGIYYACFSAWELWAWYSYLVAVVLALLVARALYLVSIALLQRPFARALGFATLTVIGCVAVFQSLELTAHSIPAHESQQASRLDRTMTFLQGTPTESFNQVTLDMLDSFRALDRHSVIAMGDRSGGLAYWGRGRLSIVQLEGLTLDVDYIRARIGGNAAGYIESFPIDYLIVDRQVVPTLTDEAGRKMYIVADPIQGRITKSAVPTFCFPSSAIVWQTSYQGDYGPNERLAFGFANRVPCSAEALSMLRSIETGVGLRQYSLPDEYDGDEYRRRRRQLEDLDRRTGS
jgi:hypothetical protein